MTERDLYAVDPQAASALYRSGYDAGVKHVRLIEIPAEWHKGFLTCLLIALSVLCFQALR